MTSEKGTVPISGKIPKVPNLNVNDEGILQGDIQESIFTFTIENESHLGSTSDSSLFTSDNPHEYTQGSSNGDIPIFDEVIFHENVKENVAAQRCVLTISYLATLYNEKCITLSYFWVFLSQFSIGVEMSQIQLVHC